MIYNILSIAGTDPSGGAGMQADLKTFSAMQTYAMSVATAIVAQNTQGVKNFKSLDATLVGEQIDAVFEDVDVHAVKIGMVPNAAIAEIIVEKLAKYQAKNIILDPVMVAKSGDLLLDDVTIDFLRSCLIPMADLITPNLLEADALLGSKTRWSLIAMQEKVGELLQLGSKAVLLTGGYLKNTTCTDIYLDENTKEELEAPRVYVKNDHGAGCTISAAIAALSPSYPLLQACEKAKSYLTNALLFSEKLTVGKDRGPLHQFYNLWQ